MYFNFLEMMRFFVQIYSFYTEVNQLLCGTSNE